MAKEEELKRVDLKVNVSCCEGCRRKVMKAMSLKGVLRTEIHPSLDKVTVVGNVDSKVLVKKLGKIGKIAEVVDTPPPEGGKKREGSSSSKGSDGSEMPALEDGKSTRKVDKGEKAAVACKHEAARSGDGERADRKPAPSKDAGAKRRSSSSDEGDRDGHSAKSSPPRLDHTAAAEEEEADATYHQHYYRPEPAMAVPHYAASYATPAYYGGGYYYAMPPPPPPPQAMPMPMPLRPPQLVRPQPSRFDEDFFNDDNTVGCHVM